MTYDEALVRLQQTRPFEGSHYERAAIEVYEHGLTCEGSRLFWALSEAIDDALLDYERDQHEMARGIEAEGRLQGDNQWLQVLFSNARWV